MIRRVLHIVLVFVIAMVSSGTLANASSYDDFTKRHRGAKGFTKIYKDGDNIYLEVPDSLIGRRVMLSTVVSKSPTPSIPTGQELSKSNVFRIAQIDSTIVFESSIEPESASMQMPAIASTFKIKYRGENSSIIDITSLLDAGNEDVLDLNGLTVGNGAIYDAYYESDKSLVGAVKGYSRSVGVERELTFELSLAEKTLGLTLADKPLFTISALTTLTLLPASTIAIRDADQRVGARTISIEFFPDNSGRVDRKIVSRWNLSGGKKIKVHFDPSIPAAWINAISDGILEWNAAFEKIGLGKVIEVVLDANSVYLMDPMTSSVAMGENSDMALAARLTTDKTTGEILGCHIQVPGDWITGIRRATTYSISDIDERFAGYNIPADAIYEVMKAQAMSIFCHCLGLQRNYAGSYAYSPSQLSDDKFTSENGFLSSVTDDVLFNWYANPSSPKGSLIADRIGPYDFYAIEWLYKDFSQEGCSKDELNTLVKSHEEDPRYLFVEATNVKTDSRSLQGDFSSDAIGSFDKAMEHLKASVASWEWLLDESIPEEYAYLWADWAWLRLSSLVSNLSYKVGSFITNDPKSVLERYVAVPKAEQKKAVEKIFSSLRDLSWLNSQKNLLLVAGANKDASGFTYANLFSASKLSSRLQVLAMATRLGANGGYTPEEFLSDMQKQMLLNASKGKLEASEETAIGMYLSWLMSFSDLAKTNYKAATGGKSLYLSEDEISMSSPDIIYEDKASLEVLCFASLRKAKTSLQKGMSLCKDSVTKGRIKYLISMIDAATEGK
ncbi:MAG: zinc-dependent metalloprotease [Bacteroidales bacterium]|nr:zinc-dependent metalloprotease [Bacteroidales bacterium]